MKLDSTGLGIGTLTPSAALDVVGNAKVSGNLTVDTNTLYVDSANNRVGVGTTNPSYTLDVVGKARITSSTAGEPALFVDGDTVGGWGLEINSHNASTASDLVLNGNAVMGVATSLTQTVSDVGGYFRWMTTATSNKTGVSGGTEKMRLNSTGLGIGTFAPSAALDVVGDAEINGNISVSSTQPLFTLSETDTGNSHRILADAGSLYIQAQDADGTNDGDMFLSGYFNNALNLLSLKAVTTAITGGNVGIGTLTPSATLDVVGDAEISGGLTLGGAAAIANVTAVIPRGTAGAIQTTTGITTSASHINFQNPNGIVGSISTSGSTTAYATTSDHRLKENVEPIQGAGDIIKAMKPVTYTFKADGSWQDGFIAHELQVLHPYAVTGEKDKMKDEEYEIEPAEEEVIDAKGKVIKPAKKAKKGVRSVPDVQMIDYSKLTPVLTAALQEALNKIDALEARLSALESS